ncbi:MAG: hypothetical protein NTV51_17205, partial [Verrucomicrobia bacterium]|nr:hypothetical protein [Verrucomicrobiota bacterium]
AQGAAEALGISAAELETYQTGGATEPLFVLKRQLAAPPPPPVAESVLLVAGDEVVRHAAVAALMTGGVEVIGVGDGLAAVSALILSPRAIAVVIVIPPMPLFAADELGAQLARLRPGVRLWLLGDREPSSTPTPFHKVGPPFRSAADFEELVNPAVPSHATRPAA